MWSQGDILNVVQHAGGDIFVAGGAMTSGQDAVGKHKKRFWILIG